MPTLTVWLSARAWLDSAATPPTPARTATANPAAVSPAQLRFIALPPSILCGENLRGDSGLTYGGAKVKADTQKPRPVPGTDVAPIGGVATPCGRGVRRAIRPGRARGR